MRLIPVVVLGGLLALAWFDVTTGIEILDKLIQIVPIDWAREFVNV